MVAELPTLSETDLNVEKAWLDVSKEEVFSYIIVAILYQNTYSFEFLLTFQQSRVCVRVSSNLSLIILLLLLIQCMTAI